MPLTWVLVRAPAGQAAVQNVFVNRRFRRPAGLTGTAFQVEVGDNTFSLRNGNALTAETVQDCPPALQNAPFPINLIALALEMVAPMAPPSPKPKTKKTGRKKTAKRKAPKRKTATKKAARKKTGRKKTTRKKAARKTTGRRS